jgi:serine/threonine-protein kinase
MRDLSRRRFVAGACATVGCGVLAGCFGADGEDSLSMDDHLSGAQGYDGSVTDRTGEDEVTVEVGAGNGLAFAPAAVRVDAGTTVLWEWTGQGGEHNVVSTASSDVDFESDRHMDAGQHFERTFENAGNALYVCEPHETSGMKGAVEVVESAEG